MEQASKIFLIVLIGIAITVLILATTAPSEQELAEAKIERERAEREFDQCMRDVIVGGLPIALCKKPEGYLE